MSSEEQMMVKKIVDCASKVIKPIATSNKKHIEEALVVGQDSASKRLEELIHSQQHKTWSRYGLVGKGGAGKTLLLKRVFNSDSLFCNHLMLWLTVSQNPSFNALRNDLVNQLSVKANERFEIREEDHVKAWLHEIMNRHKFALFLDDVWETSADCLLDELCVPHSPHHSSNIIIATSRSSRVLSKLGVSSSSIIQMQDLTEDDSWRLFSSHAFPQSDGVLPMNIDQDIARRVCNKCGGLPLALKVIGSRMVGITGSNEWKLQLQRLEKADTSSLYSTLRSSYDALAEVEDDGISLQLCFICLAAFKEDEVIYVPTAIKYWIGEGLIGGLARYQIGVRYLNFLADRCLIEPLSKDNDGDVRLFRMHDVVRDLAHQIAEEEEKCFFRTGRDLREFPDVDWSEYTRISFRNNRLTRVPRTFGAPHISSLLLTGNSCLTEIPEEVIGSMTALGVLDLSSTALQLLPENMGCLKHLVCLSLNLGSCEHLLYVPRGIADIKSLRYLNVYGCPNAWAQIGWKESTRDLLSINDLGILQRLRKLTLANYGKIVREGILGMMEQMQRLTLDLTNMESLPHDMTAMSKLKKLTLTCPQLLQIEDSFCGFQHLNYISLFNCDMLKQLPDLHKLPKLKHLMIIECPSIEKFPDEFGKVGAFPMLEEFSVVELEKLEQMPILEDGALPSLKILTIMKCEALQILPQCYWNLKSIEKIRVYGCSKVLITMEENFIEANTKVELLRLSATETQAFQERFNQMFLKEF
ncbi:disease resistance protein RPS5-like [Cryptomeria japonica]|uniref:disease resistance protein RPS5-like n=1 Tax=Cryptomeria japonica TaxID=3369 RepID=UPI0025AC77B7|nr:disease resistance protein RPS5-like [Cryptomeria japonica]